MWLRWLPWRYLATRAARAGGFIDPVPWLDRMRRFAHPAEVPEPVELLRAGALFHARGLINTRAIQNNLDWIWPYWVERQFNPADRSFIPRAFSFSHINLTHRNWTAVGLPDLAAYPIVDPRGLVTPMFDGWSLDFWVVGPPGEWLLPSKLEQAEQRLLVRENLCVWSVFAAAKSRLTTRVSLETRAGHAACVVQVLAEAPPGFELAVVVRPYNPEGISFVDAIRAADNGAGLLVNSSARVEFEQAPRQLYFSTYQQGDVSHAIEAGASESSAACPVALATAAALFPIGQEALSMEVRVPLTEGSLRKPVAVPAATPAWTDALAVCSRLQIPDARLRQLYDAAVATLILHTPGEVYPGPYTYKRFWYRDAAFILHALGALGAGARVRRALDQFPHRQTRQGYFRSQDGEWDSNGEVLWIFERHLQITGESLPAAWRAPVERGAEWIVRKRLPRDAAAPAAGLLPAGFSAEHLGPNDFYYWDNFWSVAGLRSAARLLQSERPTAAQQLARVADEYWHTVLASFRHIPSRRHRGAISAAPSRRLDSGAIGSIVADYPLQLTAPGDERVVKTVNYLLAHSSFAGGFFQNMIHSGINIYLTLHLAQVLLRAGDRRAQEMADVVARLASPTGQWPEAIHPLTLGGCMGDGQHVWAAAEWVMFLRNSFVREEADTLVLGSGILPHWLAAGEPLVFGPTATRFGGVTLHVEPVGRGEFCLRVESGWRAQPPRLEVRVPDYAATPGRAHHTFTLSPSP